MAESDPMPSYLEFVSSFYKGVSMYVQQEAGKNYSYPFDFFEDLRKYGEINYMDALYGLIATAVFACIRSALTRLVYQPFTEYFQLTEQNKKKFPESAWKATYYLFIWSCSFALLIWPGKYDSFYKPLHVFDDWKPMMIVPTDIYFTYLCQFGFYVHSIYGALYLDMWRKDSVVMIFHHFVCIALLVFSYTTRYFRIALLVFFVHDIADVWLEFSKCNVYMKNRLAGKFHRFHDRCATYGFVVFTASWFIFRLYWYPLKVVYSTSYYVVEFGPKPLPPFYAFYNGLLLVLLFLDVYWFMFIVNFLVKVATGKMKEVDDIREEEVLEEISKRQKLQANGANGHFNGVNGSAKKTT